MRPAPVARQSTAVDNFSLAYSIDTMPAPLFVILRINPRVDARRGLFSHLAEMHCVVGVCVFLSAMATRCFPAVLAQLPTLIG